MPIIKFNLGSGTGPPAEVPDLAPPPLGDDVGVPHAGKDVLALIRVVRVKHNHLVAVVIVVIAASRIGAAAAASGSAVLRRPGGSATLPPAKSSSSPRPNMGGVLFFGLAGGRQRTTTAAGNSGFLPAVVRHDALRLEDELADLVLLRRLTRVDVLPAQLGAAHAAADIGYDMRAGDQLAVLGAADADVEQVCFRHAARSGCPGVVAV